MDKFLVIDGNNLAHRAYHKFKRMSSKEGVKSSIAFGFPHILHSLINLHKPNEVLIAFDGGRDKHRLSIWPEYKGKRKDKNQKRDFDYDDFTSQIKDVQKILSCLGINYVVKKGLEADDIIWLYARKRKRKGHVVIVSTDKDFNQLLSQRISIWHPWKNKRITHKNCQVEYGYTPEECVDYLSLVGDDSDNIPGQPGIGHKRAQDFIAKYGSIKEYYTGDGEELKKFSKKEAEKLWERNRALIDIRYFCRKYLDIKKIPVTKGAKEIDRKELAMVCSKYSINKFNDSKFLDSFKSLL